MNKKGIIISGVITLSISILLIMSFINTSNSLNQEIIEENRISNYVGNVYQVYLDGEKIGLIDSKEKLYNLINNEQVEIKEEYNVNQVYPPKGFQIIKTNTYNKELSTVEEVYESIKEEKEFTIKGYTITIRKAEEEAEPIYIYVLNRDIFEQAINNVVNTFIGSNRYEQYQNNIQPEIVDTGYTIENMYFKDNITIKESYISVAEPIFTDATELTKYLLFGNNINSKEYTVVQGDTIEKIAEENKLNTSELLIANESIKSVDTLLAIGEKINVALIDPVLSLVYEELVVEDVEAVYSQEIEYDNTKYTDYSAKKQNGVNGINRITSRVQFINGESNQAVKIENQTVIRPTQNEIIVKGTKVHTGGSITGTAVDTGGVWAWPTNQPSIVTSQYGYRWGTLHDGMDISGTGYGSPIYASLDGVVVSAQYGGMMGSLAGYNIVIQHNNGYYTAYAHLSSIGVKVGQTVARGQRIGGMGDSGYVTGTHLHFGVFYGRPYNGGRSIDPRRLWQ